MIYEIRAIMFFDTLDEAMDFFTDCEMALPKATVVNPCAENQECSFADAILCHHDNHPPEECTLNQHIDNCPICP